MAEKNVSMPNKGEASRDIQSMHSELSKEYLSIICREFGMQDDKLKADTEIIKIEYLRIHATKIYADQNPWMLYFWLAPTQYAHRQDRSVPQSEWLKWSVTIDMARLPGSEAMNQNRFLSGDRREFDRKVKRLAEAVRSITESNSEYKPEVKITNSADAYKEQRRN